MGPFHHPLLCLINETDVLTRTYRLATVPCPLYPGCFRWVVSSADSHFSEQSTYPYATKAAATLVGRIRMADLSTGRIETERPGGRATSLQADQNSAGVVNE